MCNFYNENKLVFLSIPTILINSRCYIFSGLFSHNKRQYEYYIKIVNLISDMLAVSSIVYLFFVI